MQLTTPASPSLAFVQSHAWMTAPGSPVTELRPVSPDTVAVVLQDPAAPGEEEASRFLSDGASEMLADSVNGVKLVATSLGGQVGQPGGLSADEQFFVRGLPGVEDYGYLEHDNDGDGTIVDGEAAHVITVRDEATKARLDEVLTDHSVTDAGGPVVFEVEGR